MSEVVVTVPVNLYVVLDPESGRVRRVVVDDQALPDTLADAVATDGVTLVRDERDGRGETHLIDSPEDEADWPALADAWSSEWPSWDIGW